jgi:hypothetical protein
MFRFTNTFKGNSNAIGEIIKCNNKELGIFVEFNNVRHYRHFELFHNKIIINDYGNKEFNLIRNRKYISKGYGVLLEDKQLDIDINIEYKFK